MQLCVCSYAVFALFYRNPYHLCHFTQSLVVIIGDEVRT